VDDVQDPRTGLVVTLRVFGDYAMHVADPVRLVTNLTSTVDVTDNDRIAGWVSDQLLKVLRTHVTTQILRNGWPILGLMAYSAEIEQATIEAANGQLVAYGVQLTRMGNFDVNLSPEDEKQLKQLAKDTSYSQLAGGFQNYAQGEMALGAGQGMAQGGSGVDGAFLGAGFGMASGLGMQQANQLAQQLAAKQAAQQQGIPPYGGQPQAPYGQGQPAGAPAQPPAAPSAPQAAPGPVCANCQAANPGGARFCMGCGQPLAPAVAHCTECGTELPPGAHFCAGCGTRVGG
jgi:membrane protease subunit (stomatin/prohibitin family)